MGTFARGTREVVVDAHLPPFGPIEQRVRGIAGIASSHGELRMLLESAFADRWSVGVFEAVGGVNGVHLRLCPTRGVPSAA
jgi:hypothetical protein